MFYGVQYYPEHWPKERWAVDARMMQAARINVVRMGEFAWSVYEPREGTLDFSLMDEAVALLDAHGIKTIMCTPSRTPPPWVFDRYPGVRNVDAEGRLVNYGFRYTVGLSHSEFIQLGQRIDRAVIEHFAEDLKGYKQGRGSVQFPVESPLPKALVVRMIKYRMKLLSGHFV